MHGADVGDDGKVRPGNVGEVFHLAGVVHAHFQHGNLGILRHVHDRHRQAEVVIMVALGLGRVIRRLEDAGGHFLRGRLADGAGDADDLHAGQLSVARSDLAIGAERIFDLDGGQLLRDGAADQRGDRAVVDGRLGEIVPVRLRALERNEQVAGADFAGIGLHSADAEMFKPGADLAAAPVCDLLEGQFFHSVLSKYDATTSRSSRCLFSWPIS